MTKPTAALGAALAALHAAAESSRVLYAVIGGHAVNSWLEPRFTADLDATVASDPAGLERMEEALAAAGWVREHAHGEDQPSGLDFVRYQHPDDPTPLELQTAKTSIQRELLERAAGQAGPGQPRIATPEDLIVLKLIAWRPKDRIDLLGLCALPGLDWDYVRGHARTWEVEDRLESLRTG